MLYSQVVFSGGEGTVDGCGESRHGGVVLSHERYVQLWCKEMVGKPFEALQGVCRLTWEDKVSDDESAEGNTIVVHLEGRAYLALHFEDGLGGHQRIIGSVAVALGKVGIEVFDVGEVDVHDSFEGTQGVDGFIA